MQHPFQSAIESFLTDGYVPEKLLIAYDQTGKKIPSKDMPSWEPDEFIGESPEIPEDAIWEEILHSLPPPPRFHDQLPDFIDPTRMVRNEHEENQFMGSFLNEETHAEIPFATIEGFVLCHTANTVGALELKRVNQSIFLPQAGNLKFPKLEHVEESLRAGQTEAFEAPELKFVGGTLDLGWVDSICLPKLETVNEIFADAADCIILPSLKQVRSISADLARTKQIGPKIQPGIPKKRDPKNQIS